MSKDFLNINRLGDLYRPKDQRVNDYHEVEAPLAEAQIIEQAKRCMDCGIPFCHGCGCPLENAIPEINRLAGRGKFREAWEILASTSPMPEFTSRICPALCENSCTASLEFGAVMVRQIEKSVVDYAFAHGFVEPDIPAERSGRKVAVVGSGPAGLAMAIALNRAGHWVTVFESRPLPGGLLRYGIPSFKLDKALIDRRVQLMEAGSIEFRCNCEVGKDISLDYLSRTFDAVAICTGTPAPRDLAVENRNLGNILFALDYLNGGASAEGKNVVVIGGGDTGSDCVGMAIRQRAKSITQIEIMPEPPGTRPASTPWPLWSRELRTSSSHKEGGTRRWSLQTVRFLGKEGTVTGVEVAPVEWTFSPDGVPLKFTAGKKTEVLPAELVTLAMGFLKPDHRLPFPNVFVSGDAGLGPSLVVRAIADAGKIAGKMDSFLKEAQQ